MYSFLKTLTSFSDLAEEQTASGTSSLNKADFAAQLDFSHFSTFDEVEKQYAAGNVITQKWRMAIEIILHLIK